MAKSYWQEVYVGGEDSKLAIKSWFGALAEDLTPYKAEILCDVETDREKKMRAFMTNARGDHFKLERTLGGRTFTVSRAVCKPPKDEESRP